MPEFTYQGIGPLQKAIETVPNIALEAAEAAMPHALTFLHGALPPYPPTLPNQKYKRTGTLGKSFRERTEVLPDAVIGTLGSGLDYAPWVVGPDFPGEVINGESMYQARIHVDRWWQLGDVVENNIEIAWKVFEEEFWINFDRLWSKVLDQAEAKDV